MGLITTSNDLPDGQRYKQVSVKNCTFTLKIFCLNLRHWRSLITSVKNSVCLFSITETSPDMRNILDGWSSGVMKGRKFRGKNEMTSVKP